MAEPPNILSFHVDNLGFAQLSCCSGGPFRGTWTRRIDTFAGRGFRLTNYAPEAQCTPTRSALLTGRHAIRSGNHSVPLGSSDSWGLVVWEHDHRLLPGAAAAEGLSRQGLLLGHAMHDGVVSIVLEPGNPHIGICRKLARHAGNFVRLSWALRGRAVCHFLAVV